MGWCWVSTRMVTSVFSLKRQTSSTRELVDAWMNFSVSTYWTWIVSAFSFFEMVNDIVPQYEMLSVTQVLLDFLESRPCIVIILVSDFLTLISSHRNRSSLANLNRLWSKNTRQWSSQTTFQFCMPKWVEISTNRRQSPIVSVFSRVVRAAVFDSPYYFIRHSFRTFSKKGPG